MSVWNVAPCARRCWPRTLWCLLRYVCKVRNVCGHVLTSALLARLRSVRTLYA